MSARVPIVLRAERWELAEKIAKDRGISVEDVIDLVLEAGLAKYEPRSAMKCGALPANRTRPAQGYRGTGDHAEAWETVGPCQRKPGHKRGPHVDIDGRRFTEVAPGTQARP